MNLIKIGLGLMHHGVEPSLSKAFAAMTVQPSPDRKRAYENIVRALQVPVSGGSASGIWPLLDRLTIIAAHDEQAGRVDLVTGTEAVVNHGASYTIDQGYAGNGTSTYIDTGFLISGGTNFTQNSAIIGQWSRTDQQSNNAQGGQNGGTSLTTVQMRTTSNSFTYRINQNTGTSGGTVSDSLGLIVMHRGDGTNATGAYMKNGVRIAGGTNQVSTAPAAFSYFLGAQNVAGTASTFSTYQFAVFVAGGGFGLTTVRDANHLALYNALNTYKWW